VWEHPLLSSRAVPQAAADPEQTMTRCRPLPAAPRRRLAALLAAAACALLPAAAIAQVWPSKPVRLLIGFPPGGQNDTLGRLVAQRLSAALGQQFIVDNRPGAGGNLAAELVVRAAPDGYTLFLSSLPFAANPALYKTVPYQERDFVAVSGIGSSPMVLSVHPSVPFRSAGELLRYARQHPGKLNYGSGGVGSSQHLAFGLFQSLTGARLTHIPYKGGGPSLAALAAGEVDALMAALTVTSPLAQQGRIRPLVIAQEEASALLPGVPSARQAGMPQLLIGNWAGVMAPAQTPPDVVRRLHAEVQKALEHPELRERFAALGAEPMRGPQPEFQSFVRAEFQKWARVVRDAGIEPQ
jgi:tripartite-type tricarboxylate transporter receptor subunit TctC